VIFVADSFANRIVMIDPSTGAQSVVHDYSTQFGDFGPSDVGPPRPGSTSRTPSKGSTAATSSSRRRTVSTA